MEWSLCLSLFLAASTCVVKSQDDQMPPKMSSSFNNAYFYPQNTTLTAATINCTAINGQIKYEWKKDGDVIKNNKYVSVNISTGTLRFVQMHDADYGTYQCFATNDHGTAISKPFNVYESKLLPFPSSEVTQVQEVNCTQYEHCIIPCRDKPSCIPYSQCRVVWKIGEGAAVEFTKRVGVDSNGDLHLLWSNTNDWTGLPYICGVWQKQMNKWVWGSETYLRIVQATQTPEIRPFRVFCKNGTALNGENGVLSCMFAGYPVPEVEWISPTNMTIKDTPGKYEISDFGRVLTILQAEPEFEGDYICKGKGKESDACSVFLNVTSAPILKGDNQMKDITVFTGENATFLCNVSSLPMELPPSPPKWKKNGMDLDIDGGKYIMFDNNRVLTVTDVQKASDTGVYQCMSENSEGVLLEGAILMVNVSKQTSSDNQNTVSGSVNVITIFLAVGGSIISIVLIGIGIFLVKRRVNRHRKRIYSQRITSTLYPKNSNEDGFVLGLYANKKAFSEN